MLDLKELYWLAGLIEGEGCFLLDKRSNSCLRFSMAMTDKSVLKHAQKIINLGFIKGPYWAKMSTKPYWYWRIDKDKDVAALMMTIYPLMWNDRQEKIEDLLEIWRSRPKVDHRNG